MKKLIFLISLVVFCNCSESTNEVNNENTSDEYLNITSKLSYQEFEEIKNFILEKGDQSSYSNMYNNNPHFSFEDFECYLNPEIGQGNINCDQSISDFNVLVIQDLGQTFDYYYVQSVREGDLSNETIIVEEGMRERNNYLLKLERYNHELSEANDSINNYLSKIKSVVNNY
jgi:hypothetical protein